jgi:hypothetical protein
LEASDRILKIVIWKYPKPDKGSGNRQKYPLDEKQREREQPLSNSGGGMEHRQRTPHHKVPGGYPTGCPAPKIPVHREPEREQKQTGHEERHRHSHDHTLLLGIGSAGRSDYEEHGHLNKESQ